MSSELPLVSCLCPTFGRPHVLREAIWCFLQQDYANKELIIVNDHPNPITLDREYPGVRLINLPERFANLGEKRNYTTRLARGEILCVWDDDDLYLPWRLKQTVRHLMENPDTWAYKPMHAWLSVNNSGYRIQRALFHSQLGMRRAAFDCVGGYPAMNVGEDQAFEDRIPRDKWVRHLAAAAEFIYVYRWGNTHTHISQLGNDAPGKPTSWDRMEKQHRQSPGGTITPGFDRDYWQEMIDELAVSKRVPASEVQWLTKFLAPYHSLGPGEVQDMEPSAGKESLAMRMEAVGALAGSIQGWLTRGEGARLYELARFDAPVPVAVELGSWKGCSTTWLASAMRDRGEGLVYAVDHWQGSRAEEIHQSMLAGYKADQLYQEFLGNLHRVGLSDWVTPMRAETAKASREWSPDREIGLLFIDASHEYEDVRKDFEVWSPMVARGGLIAFHDVPGWPGPTRVVSELPGWVKPVGAVDNLWVGRKT